MKISRDKIDLVMSRRQFTVTQLSKSYGVSRARMNVILNSVKISPVTAGRLAKALGVDVTEILED